MDKHKSFTVTANHLGLLLSVRFRYDNSMEFGAACVDPKRPYGNSDVWRDLADILGVVPEVTSDWDEPRFSENQEAQMLRQHKEMAIVLQILADNAVLGIELGEYQAPLYGKGWLKV